MDLEPNAGFCFEGCGGGPFGALAGRSGWGNLAWRSVSDWGWDVLPVVGPPLVLLLGSGALTGRSAEEPSGRLEAGRNVRLCASARFLAGIGPLLGQEPFESCGAHGVLTDTLVQKLAVPRRQSLVPDQSTPTPNAGEPPRDRGRERSGREPKSLQFRRCGIHQQKQLLISIN